MGVTKADATGAHVSSPELLERMEAPEADA